MIAPAHFTTSPSPIRRQVSRSERAALSREEARHDADLVRHFNAGSPAAFAEIVARYRERMFAIAFAMLHNHADAEEIAQDTFVRAHRALGKFRGDSSLATWLHRIALNLARNRYWYFFRRGRHMTLSLDSSVGDGNPSTFSDLLADDTASPRQEAAASEFAEVVGRCMSRLREGPRHILVLRNSLNRSYGEIAQELGVSIGTVKSRIARAREMLRTLVVEACPELGAESRPADWFEVIRPGGVGLAAVSV